MENETYRNYSDDLRRRFHVYYEQREDYDRRIRNGILGTVVLALLLLAQCIAYAV